MKFRLLLVPSILLGILCLSTSVSDATILIKKDLAQLAAESETIVIATVGAQECRRPHGVNAIFTFSDLKIEKTLKGKASKAMVVANIGGILNGRGLSVASMPQFHSGTRVLLFLKKDIMGNQRVYGAIQGMFQVVHNRATDEDVVKLNGGISYVTNKFFATKKDPAPKVVGVEEFEAKVAELIVKASKKVSKKGEKK
ncbi:MAG: hypothetical protein ACI97A_002994 [Planctomycetota bacterium]|jgi:hypothetical protein